MMETIRAIQATNGTEVRDLAVVRKDGKDYLWDVTADPNMDSLEEILDASDTSISDAIRANGFDLMDE